MKLKTKMKIKTFGITTLVALIVGLFSSCAIPVPVSVPAIVTFNVIPQTINAGESAVLVWAATDATNVVIEPGIGPVPQTGSREVSPTNTTTYVMTATGVSGTTTRLVMITVKPRVTITGFTSSPSAIALGGNSTLRWDVIGATSVTIDQGIGSVPSSGSRVVSPSTTTTYTMTAVGGSQVATASSIVVVNSPPVVAQFTASPQQIQLGASSQISWDVRGAIRIRIDPGIGPVPTLGSLIVQPFTTTTYVLIAENDWGVINRTVTVIVQESPAVGNPVITLTAQYLGGTSWQLNWNVLYATQIDIEPDVGRVGPTGSTVVNMPSGQTRIYRLNAANDWGWAWRQVILVSP